MVKKFLQIPLLIVGLISITENCYASDDDREDGIRDKKTKGNPTQVTYADKSKGEEEWRGKDWRISGSTSSWSKVSGTDLLPPSSDDEDGAASSIAAPAPAIVAADEREKRRAELNSSIEVLQDNLKDLREDKDAGDMMQRANIQQKIIVLKSQLSKLDNGK